MRKTVKQKGLSGNGSAGQPSIELPVGMELFKLIMVNTAVGSAITTLTSFELNVNGENVMPLNGQDIDEINKFDGLGAYATNKVLVLDFENQKFIDAGPKMACSLNTGVPAPLFLADGKTPNPNAGKIISSLNLTWTQSGADSWDIYAVFDVPDPVGPGAIKRFQKFGDQASNGETSTTQLLYGTAKQALQRRIFLIPPAGTISQVRVLLGLDNKEIWKRQTAWNKQMQTDQGKVPGTYFGFVLDWTENNTPDYMNTLTSDFVNPATGIAISKSLSVMITDSTAEQVIWIVENVGAPD